ncbi:hypothetical protein SEA_WILDWEST_52 [Arthrobacter phage Wildwest]|uniref:Uncharacterized protein n=1 Tax=Arthrobacter phage Wildwest TaxID=3051767 RepID=A0AA96KKN8_9CAUD|nr:hypothetical protein SEA_WILDWEST_52 [Arthrobacter phage Wildwest]
MSESRYTPAKAAYVETRTGTPAPASWGVLDNETGLFAPFGFTSRDGAEFAAGRVAELPDAGWDFVEPLDLVTEEAPAPRFEWIEAVYTEANGASETAFGAVDNELNRFYPFSDVANDPDASGFVADLAMHPEGKYSFAQSFTRAN